MARRTTKERIKANLASQAKIAALKTFADNEYIQTFFSEMDRRTIDAMVACKPDDDDTRRHLAYVLQAGRALNHYVRNTATKGPAEEKAYLKLVELDDGEAK